MTVLEELLPEAKLLSRGDQLRLIQVLAEDLAGDEDRGMEANQAYAISSPDSASEAADVMLRALAADGPQR